MIFFSILPRPFLQSLYQLEKFCKISENTSWTNIYTRCLFSKMRGHMHCFYACSNQKATSLAKAKSAKKSDPNLSV